MILTQLFTPVKRQMFSKERTIMNLDHISRSSLTYSAAPLPSHFLIHDRCGHRPGTWFMHCQCKGILCPPRRTQKDDSRCGVRYPTNASIGRRGRLPGTTSVRITGLLIYKKITARITAITNAGSIFKIFSFLISRILTPRPIRSSPPTAVISAITGTEKTSFKAEARRVSPP